MICLKNIAAVFVCVGTVVYAVNSKAQSFGVDDFSNSNTFNQNNTSSQKMITVPPATQADVDKARAQRKTAPQAAQSQTKPAATAAAKSTENKGVFVPKSEQAKMQGKTNQPNNASQERGYVGISRVQKPGEKPNPKEDKSLIFLFIDSYKIDRSMTGRIACDVRFVVLTSLGTKLSNLNVKLKWPQMVTNLAFYDVDSNIPTYLDYRLTGEGCYTMDKMPNIVVNRCRAKGVTQQDCAKKIRWLVK